MQKSMFLFAATLLAATLPTVANAGEMVEFAFKESELATAEKREMLLDRIEKVSLQYCDTGSAVAPRFAVERCAVDLKEQFIAAIGDADLALLAESEERSPFRTASR